MFLCIYVLFKLYTKHKFTQASSMPERAQFLSCYYFDFLLLFSNVMKIKNYKLTI